MAIAALLVPAVALGQAVGSTRCVPKTPTESLSVFVTGSLYSFDPRKKLSTTYGQLLLETIRGALHPPRPLPAVVYTSRDSIPGQPRDTTSAFPGLVAMIAFSIGRAGEQPAIIATSLSPAFDSSIVRAVRAAIEDTTLVEPPELARHGMIPLRLRIFTEEHPDSSFPLLRLRVPLGAVDKQAAPRRGNPAPSYPHYLRDANIEGEVRMSFTIDQDGLPVLNSYVVDSTTHPFFTQSVMAVLPRHRYTPSVVAGCPVARYVGQEFRFRLR